LASSKTILVDTISICPRHFSFGYIQLIKKQTYAICNECTGAFCREHIFQVDSKYYCEEHNPNKPQVQESAADQTVKKAEDTVKKAMSGFGSFFKK
jgi:predicted nucleic acid binding AN1-type Zn finger protein